MTANATIEDVARLAEVSIATVSRTIHFPEKVSKSTRQKVNHAIAVTGYTANALARGLRLGKSNMVLVIVPDISEPNIPDILTGLENEARNLGYGVLIGHTQGEPERGQEYLKYFSSNQAAGLILLTGLAPVLNVDGPKRAPPCVGVFEPIAGHSTPYVGADDFEGARKAVDLLITEGHRSIAFIGRCPSKLSFSRRMAGYQAALAATKIDLRHKLILDGDGTIESGRVAVEQLFIRDTLPSAFMCANDQIAIGVTLGLNARGYHIPDDFSVIGFDDIPQSKFLSPPLTTLRQPRAALGQNAMRQLVSIIDGNAKLERELLLVPELIVRSSVGRRSDRFNYC